MFQLFTYLFVKRRNSANIIKKNDCQVFFVVWVFLFFIFMAEGIDKSFIDLAGEIIIDMIDGIDFIEIKKPGPKSPGFGWLMPLGHHRRVIG